MSQKNRFNINFSAYFTRIRNEKIMVTMSEIFSDLICTKLFYCTGILFVQTIFRRVQKEILNTYLASPTLNHLRYERIVTFVFEVDELNNFRCPASAAHHSIKKTKFWVRAKAKFL